MKEPISIKEILAIVIKHGKAVIVTAIAFAVLLGGIQGLQDFNAARSPENTPEKVAQRNEEALEEYNSQTAILNRYIANVEHKLEKQQEYNDESLLMNLDPYGKYASHVVLSVTEVEEDAFLQVYKQQGTPVDYIVTRIINQYVIAWENMDIGEKLVNNPYADVHEKYVRELISVYKTDGGTLTIAVSADTEANARDLCQSVYNAILEVQPTICEATYDHALSVISTATKQMVDYDLDKNQIINQENIDEYLVQLEEYRQDMAKIKKPAAETVVTTGDAVKTAIKWGIIGGVVGFVLACGCIWLIYIVKDGVETSRQAEAILGVPFFGSTAGRKSLFLRLSNWFVGERQWKDANEAAAYIAENVKARLDAPAAIALVSTVDVSESDTGIQRVLEAMKAQGHTVRFAARAEQNPAAVAALRDSDYVVMAERLGVSNRSAMVCIIEQAKQLDSKLLGFITV